EHHTEALEKLISCIHCGLTVSATNDESVVPGHVEGPQDESVRLQPVKPEGAMRVRLFHNLIRAGASSQYPGYIRWGLARLFRAHDRESGTGQGSHIALEFVPQIVQGSRYPR